MTKCLMMEKKRKDADTIDKEGKEVANGEINENGRKENEDPAEEKQEMETDVNEQRFMPKMELSR